VNAREYIHQELNTELIAGHVYSIGFALKFGSRMKYIINSFGMYISDTAIGPTSNPTLNDIIPVTPQLNLNVPLADSSEWTVLSMDYTALGGEKFITLGNFTPDALLNISINPLNDPSDTHLFAKYSSYFFIDSVFIYDQDTSSSSSAALSEQNLNLSVQVSPNPASGFLHLEVDKNIALTEIVLLDMLGRTVRTYFKEERTLDISNLVKGEYFLQVNTELGNAVKKVIVE
jgi:hypothetical protein